MGPQFLQWSWKRKRAWSRDTRQLKEGSSGHPFLFLVHSEYSLQMYQAVASVEYLDKGQIVKATPYHFRRKSEMAPASEEVVSFLLFILFIKDLREIVISTNNSQISGRRERSTNGSDWRCAWGDVRSLFTTENESIDSEERAETGTNNFRIQK